MSEDIKEKLDLFPDNMNEIAKDAYYQLESHINNLEQENQQLKEQIKLYETYLNRFFKINNKSYDGKVVLEQLKQRDEVIEKIITNWNALEKYIDENKMILNNSNIFQYYLIQKEILNKYKGDNNEQSYENI